MKISHAESKKLGEDAELIFFLLVRNYSCPADRIDSENLSILDFAKLTAVAKSTRSDWLEVLSISSKTLPEFAKSILDCGRYGTFYNKP